MKRLVSAKLPREKRHPLAVELASVGGLKATNRHTQTAYHTWLDIFHDWALYGDPASERLAKKKLTGSTPDVKALTKHIGEPVTSVGSALLIISKKFAIEFPTLLGVPHRHHHESVSVDNVKDTIPSCSSTMLSPTTNYAYSWSAQEILNRVAARNNYARIHWCTAAQHSRTFGSMLRLAQEPTNIASEFGSVYPFSWLDKETQAFILSTTPFTRKTRLSSSSEGKPHPFEGVFILRQGTGVRKQRNQSHSDGKLQWVRLKPWTKTEMFLCHRDKQHMPDRQKTALYVTSGFVSSRGLKLYPPAQLIKNQKMEWETLKGPDRVKRFLSIPETRSNFPYPPVQTKPYFVNVAGPRLAKSGSWGWTPRWELFSLVARKLHELSCPDAPRPVWLDHQVQHESPSASNIVIRAEVPPTHIDTDVSTRGYSWTDVAPIEIGFRFPTKVYNADQLVVPAKGEPTRGLAVSVSGKRIPQPANDILIAMSVFRGYASPFWATSGQARRMGLLFDAEDGIKVPTISGRALPLSSLRRPVQEWLLGEFRRYAILKGDIDLIALVNASVNTMPPPLKTPRDDLPRLTIATTTPIVDDEDDADSAIAGLTGFYMYGCNGWERIHSQGPLAAFVSGYRDNNGRHVFLWVNIDEAVVLLPPRIQRACVPSHYFDLSPEEEKKLIFNEASWEQRELRSSLGVNEFLHVHPCAKYILERDSAIIDLATVSQKTYFNGSVLKVGTDEGPANFTAATAAISSQSALCIGTDGRPFPLRISEKLLQHAATRDFMSPVWLTTSTAGKLGVYIKPEEKALGFKPLHENSTEGLMSLAKPPTTVYSLLYAEDPITFAKRHCAHVLANMTRMNQPTSEMAAIVSRSNIKHVNQTDMQEMPARIPTGYIKLTEKRWRSIASFLTRKQKIFLSQLSLEQQKVYLALYARFFESMEQRGGDKFRRRNRVPQATYQRFAVSVAQKFPEQAARELLGKKKWFDPSTNADPFSLCPHFQLVLNGKLQGYSKYATKQLQDASEAPDLRDRIKHLVELHPEHEELLMKCAHFWISEDEVVLGGVRMIEASIPISIHAFVNGKGVLGCRGVDAARVMKRITTNEAAALAFPHKGNGQQSKWAFRKNVRRFNRRFYANKQNRTWYNADQTTDPQRVLALTQYFNRPAM